MQTSDSVQEIICSQSATSQEVVGSTARGTIESLPNEALTNIMSFLDYKDLVR